jgi:hypothetical protein
MLSQANFYKIINKWDHIKILQKFQETLAGISEIDVGLEQIPKCQLYHIWSDQ